MFPAEGSQAIQKVSQRSFEEPPMESQASNGTRLQAAYSWRSDPTSLLHRTRASLWEKSPQLQKSLQQISSELVRWMQKGSPWRAFLVSIVAVVTLLGLAGLGTFMLFFLAATLNAIAIGFLASVASVGAFVALFFSSLTAIYVGALVIAIFVISTITFFCICAALIAAGWIAFLWVMWQGLMKGLQFVKTFFKVSAPKISSTNGNLENYYDQQMQKQCLKIP